MDVWGFIQTPMLGRKSWQNYQGDVAREKLVKHQSCKSFPPAKSEVLTRTFPFQSFKLQASCHALHLIQHLYNSQNNPDLAPKKARRPLEDLREWLEKSLIFFVHAMAFL